MMESNNNEFDNNERRNSNTEYIPTKCRVTKPPPPKPATNPLQFVKVAPCPLFQKAQEQIKKVEEIKRERKEVREEAEDWQQNLDNWKSCRRKRQEHIIERVVEVKKFEQEEQERTKRKSKTFHEMMEDRNIRGRHKFNIPIFEDDSNDLSDYGIGSSSSKTNSIKDVDTDDSSSILDDKDSSFDSSPFNNKDNSSASNQSQSEDETNLNKKTTQSSNSTTTVTSTSISNNNTNNNSNNNYKGAQQTVATANFVTVSKSESNTTSKFPQQTTTSENKTEITEQYTYEGAIQDYRSRIRNKIHVDESIFTRNQDAPNKSKEFAEAQSVLPKGELWKRKELFESEKTVEITNYESHTSRRLSEDFSNTQSIKQRLQSLQKCTTDPSSNYAPDSKADVQTVKQRLQNFNNKPNTDNKPRPVTKISNYLIGKSASNGVSVDNRNVNNEKKADVERCSSPETEIYIDNLRSFSKDLDTLMYGKPTNGLVEDYCVNPNYPPSTSSTELTGASDREDSGIHTADVSCSVSQADEPVEDTELAAATIPSCIEKLTIAENNNLLQTGEPNTPTGIMEAKKDFAPSTATDEHQFENEDEDESAVTLPEATKTKSQVVDGTIKLLEALKRDSSENLQPNRVETIESDVKGEPLGENLNEPEPQAFKNHVKIYENVDIYDPGASEVEFVSSDDIVVDSSIPLAPPTMKEPPKVKPPPPPPPVTDNIPPQPEMRRVNSTKRIKKEIHLKRSSFLGLGEPTDDQLYPEINIDKPPDINSFLQKESKLEKSLYKKTQEENRMGLLSKVESHDSGLDIDRGRLSSDTWCSSSIGDSNTPSPERQDSEPTNSITSEEDEITKKEREIIEMVEKEEKSRDIVEYLLPNDHKNIANQNSPSRNPKAGLSEPYLGSESFNGPYFPAQESSASSIYLDDQDSEVLKVENELRQLEIEELKRQRENVLFQESRAAKARLQQQNNRHSLENIFDVDYPPYVDGVAYRKSMPELQHIPLEYRKSLPDVPNAYNVYRAGPELEMQYRKSMPDIQHAYHKSVPEYHKSSDTAVDHRKSMPDIQRSAFKSPPPVERQPIMPGKPLRPLVNRDQKERFMMMNPVSDAVQLGKPRQLSRHSLQALSAIPKNRHLPVDNWIQPRANPEKNYKQHWLIQEAELRRITEQQKNQAAANRNWQQPRQEKHLPDSVIQTLTQRAQNRAELNNERNQPIIRQSDSTSPNKEPNMHHPYLGHNQTMGHALPTMPFQPPPMALEESQQDRMLSVSGKKKCSNCSKELGRGAAMIIESLCLFYHMECFICCVCHMQLGDGRMGTDVRVRNQKLHCHNCYSSDDGIKFSCV